MGAELILSSYCKYVKGSVLISFLEASLIKGAKLICQGASLIKGAKLILSCQVIRLLIL